jgi:transposase
MVAAVRSGRSQHEVAQEFHVSQSTVHHWVHHAHGQRLDRVDWHDRPHTTRTRSRTDPIIEDLVLTVRTELERGSDLGFHGADAIHEVLKGRKLEPLPAVRTITASSNDGGPWTVGDAPVAPPRHRVGICPRSPRSGGNWTASTWSRVW